MQQCLLTVAQLESKLKLWMEHQYRSYCECNDKNRGFVFERPTISVLAEMVKKNKSTVSDALQIKLPIAQRKHESLAILWETSQSWGATRRYGQKHFGSLGKR